MIEFMAANKAMFIIAAGIFVGAIIGVIYGVVTKGRWEDHGLMVRDGNKLRWPPGELISVFYTAELSRLWLHAWGNAVRTLEAAIGKAVFVPATEAPAALDLGQFRGIVLRSSDDPNASTGLGWDAEGYLVAVVVTFPRKLSEGVSWSEAAVAATLLDAVALHEGGHTLGLDHDDQQTRSFMAPTLHERPLDGQGISKYDAETLRRNYGG